jgi:hypothetical protein
MKVKKVIGWQKYEDVIENQLSSPMFKELIKNLISGVKSAETHYGDHFLEEEEYATSEEEDVPTNFLIPVPVSDDLVNEITLMSTFDCWIGHTNFDITPSVRKILDKINGVEVLKICSRYRFFIGVGKMFEFKSVRENIERTIKEKENNGNERKN